MEKETITVTVRRGRYSSKEYKDMVALFRREGMAYALNMRKMIKDDLLPWPKKYTKQQYYDLVDSVIREYELQVKEAQNKQNKQK